MSRRAHPISCREFIEFLIDYVENALPEQQRREFDRHMSMCPACVAYLNTYRQTIAAGKAALGRPEDPLPEEVPADLVKAILSARDKA